MTGYEAEAEAVQAYFAPRWANRTPVGYDGLSFTPSHESIQIDILGGQGFQASIGAPGSNVARYAGVVAIRVFTNMGSSSLVSRRIEDAVTAIFRNAEVGSIRFGIPYVSGSEITPPWRTRTVMCPYVRDSFHA